MEKGKVWLVGAGPGDAELLTKKAERVLNMADVIVYDALVGQAIIAGLPETAEKVYVGKRSSHHAMPQEEISRLLVSYAERGKRVVIPFCLAEEEKRSKSCLRAGSITRWCRESLRHWRYRLTMESL